jgi:protein-arginine deiminase (PAD)
MEFEDAQQNQIEIDHVDPDVQRLLHKQKQPVVEVDTSWLDVGHVDEVLTFVPDRHGSQPSAALRASSGLAMKIIAGAAARYQDGLSQYDPQRVYTHPSGVLQRLTSAGSAPVSRLMRGKVWMQIHPRATTSSPVPDVVDPPRMYQDLAFALNGGDPTNTAASPYNIHDIHYQPGEGPDRAYPADITVLELLYTDRDNAGQSTNAFVEDTYLAPIDQIVSYGFPGVRMFPLPVVFDRVASTSHWSASPWSFSTSAFTPDLVNLQALNGHLLVPRPYGPRMAPDDATAVLQAVLADYSWGRQLAGQLTGNFYRRNGLDVTNCWIMKQDEVTVTISTSGLINQVFGGIKNLDDVANCFIDGFPGKTTQEVGRLILRDNPRNFDPTGALRDGWRRFMIREGTVDLFETYVQLVATTLGQTLHFVDSWFYHLRYGGIHCATNVIREPRPGQIPSWWTV